MRDAIMMAVAFVTAALCGCGDREPAASERTFGPKNPTPVAAPAPSRKPDLPEKPALLPPTATETPAKGEKAPDAPTKASAKSEKPSGPSTAAGPESAEAAPTQPDKPSPYAHLTRWTVTTPDPFKIVPAKTGSISGVIENPGKCTGVAALARGTGDPRKMKVLRGQYDPATGRFAVGNLPPDTYDLRVYVPGGWIDGANLRPAARQGEGKPIGEDDLKEIVDKIENFPDRFVDIIRPLAVAGTDTHAKVLVEKIRYRQFHSGKQGERVWRVEVWDYTSYYGGWVKEQHGWLVLSRIRAPFGKTTAEDLRNLLWLFDPALGGLRIEKGRAVAELRYRVPGKLTLAMGKTPGSLDRLVAEDVKKKAGKDQEP